MRRDEPAYFMENGTERLVRPVNVLPNVIILRKVFLADINPRIRAKPSNSRFRPDELVVGPGAGGPHRLPVRTSCFWKWPAPVNLPCGYGCNPVSGSRGWGDGTRKGFVDQIVHRVWGDVVQIVEEIEASSNTLEVGCAEGKVPLPCIFPAVVCGSIRMEGALTIVISPSQVIVFFEETIKVLQPFGGWNTVIAPSWPQKELVHPAPATSPTRVPFYAAARVPQTIRSMACCVRHFGEAGRMSGR